MKFKVSCSILTYYQQRILKQRLMIKLQSILE